MAYTPFAVSETAICNLAGSTLDEVPLASINDDTVWGRFCARNYAQVRDEVIRSHPWSCLVTRAALSADISAPAFGWAYQYTLPTDCLRLLPLRNSDGYWNGQPMRYELESRKILTDAAAPLYIRYVRGDNDTTKFDPHLVRVIAQSLALYGAQRITGKGSYVNKAGEFLSGAMQQAYLSNALEMGTPEPVNYGNTPDAAVLAVRYGA